MRAPIYSNNPPLHDNDCKLQNRFIALLSDSIVDRNSTKVALFVRTWNIFVYTV